MKTLLLAAVLLPLTALAHPWTPPLEPLAPGPAPVVELRAPPPFEVRPPPVARRPDREDDARDLWSVDGTLAQLDRAAATRDLRLLRWVDARARGLLGDEVRESQREVERARFEASRGNGWALRRAEWKLAQIARLDDGYRTLAWRLDPWSVAQRRAILVDLDRLNRRELAAR
ncbi:MAG TPA: hypothetical protein VLT82_23350 [Myxococcaceae bacterium]|nr:hypothetical protein [Myxococcaceae bacterium]